MDIINFMNFDVNRYTAIKSLLKKINPAARWFFFIGIVGFIIILYFLT